jgi:gliding motility-associated-like protein
MLFGSKFSFAQYDYIHYIPPLLNGSEYGNDVGYHVLVFSTNSTKDVNIKVYKGDGSLYTTDNIVVSRGKPYRLRMKCVKPKGGDQYYGEVGSSYPNNVNFPYNVVGPDKVNQVLTEGGLRCISYDAPFFVNVRHSSKIHGGSLTSKGSYAFGKEFYTGHTYNYGWFGADQYRRSHFISVMAVEDTDVTFSGFKGGYLFKFTGGILTQEEFKPTDTRTISLKAGESYVIGNAVSKYLFHEGNPMARKDWDNDGDIDTEDARALWNGMNGTHIQSTGKIVVNSGSWTAGGYNSAQDMGFDQLVPTEHVRDRYIVMRGEGDYSTERSIVVATQDDTDVYIANKKVANLKKAGDFVALSPFFDKWNRRIADYAYIDTKDKPVYLFQTASANPGSIAPTVGMNFIPPLTATGIKEVTVPYTNQIATKDVSSLVTILTRKNVDVQYIKSMGGVDKTSFLTKKDEIAIPGTTEWVAYKVPTGGDTGIETNFRFKSAKSINVAWLVTKGVVGAAGYYSGFTKAISSITPDIGIVDPDLDFICESSDTQIQVSLKDPKPNFYEWYVDSYANFHSKNGPLRISPPDKDTKYIVKGYYMDPTMDILFNGDFSDGYNGFETDYTMLDRVPDGWGGYHDPALRVPGESSIAFSPKNLGAEYEDFHAKDDGNMFVGYSKTSGEISYQVPSLPVYQNNAYIFRMYARLAKDIDNVNFFAQNFKVMVDDEVIIDNFRVDDVSKWQSVNAMWKSPKNQNINLKIVNGNTGNRSSVFAIDSICFMDAVTDEAIFLAKVVPNLSYNDMKEAHLCQGTDYTIDISNGDTSWYKYQWAKKQADGTYANLTNGSKYLGVTSHMLTVKDPQQLDEGEYRCHIEFKDEYAECGTVAAAADCDINVFVDRVSTVSLTSDKTSLCAGNVANITSRVTGDSDNVKWYLDGGTDVVSVDENYRFDLITPGDHEVKCVAENGCGTSTAKLTVAVLSAPVLNTVDASPNICEKSDFTLTANATGDGTLKYYWAQDGAAFGDNGRIQTLTAEMPHKDATFSVSVSSFYPTKGVECPALVPLEINSLDVSPVVDFTEVLKDKAFCAGFGSHTLEVKMKQDLSYYDFSWEKDGVTIAGENSNSILISPLQAVDAGRYSVNVSTKCDNKTSTAQLDITDRLIVDDINIFPAESNFCAPTDVTVTFTDNGAVKGYYAINPKGIKVPITNPYTFEVNGTNSGYWIFGVEPICGTIGVTKFRIFNMVTPFTGVTMDDINTCVGNNVQFQVNIATMSPYGILKYAWTKDGVAIPGETGPVLKIDDVEMGDVGNYECTISDQCGTTKAVNADLNIDAVISATHDAAINLCVGANHTLTAEVSPSARATATYKWWKNNPTGPALKTSEDYGFTGITEADAGIYYCEISLACGDTKMIEREIIVHKLPTLIGANVENHHICQSTKPELKVDFDDPSGTYALTWEDGAGVDLGNAGVKTFLYTDTGIKAVKVVKAVISGFCGRVEKTFNITIDAKPSLSIVDNTITHCSNTDLTMNVTTGGDFNSVNWYKGTSTTSLSNTDTYTIVNPRNPAHTDIYKVVLDAAVCKDAEISVSVDILNAPAVVARSPKDNSLCEGTNVEFSVTTSGDDVSYMWYKDGTDIADPGFVPLSRAHNYIIDKAKLADAGTYKCVISNPIACGDIVLDYNLVVKPNAVVTTNPTDNTICEDQASIEFNAAGTASGTVKYQWFSTTRNKLVGETNPKLTVNRPYTDGEGFYCEVSGDDCLKATTTTAFVNVVEKVRVTTNPSSITIDDGEDVVFTVVATGEPTIRYQWKMFNAGAWVNVNNIVGKITGAQTAKLTIINALKADYNGKRFRCEVSTSGLVCKNTVNSTEATINTNDVEKIKTQAFDTKTCFNTDAVLTVVGQKAGLTYSWEYKKTAGGTFKSADGKDGMTVVSSATDSKLTVPADDMDIDNWIFRCLVSDGKSTPQYSHEVQIDVLSDVVLTSPADNTLARCENSKTVFTVTATGDELKYKWYNQADPATILSSSNKLNLGRVVLADAGVYFCEVYSDYCGFEKAKYTLEVRENAKITVQPVLDPLCADVTTKTISVDGTTYGTNKYTWFKNGSRIRGAVDKDYTITSFVEGDYYQVRLEAQEGGCAKPLSDKVYVDILDLATVKKHPDATFVRDGENAEFKVEAAGDGTFTYQWQKSDDGGATWANLPEAGRYSNTKTATLSVAPCIAAEDEHDKFRCVITSVLCGNSVTSRDAELFVILEALVVGQPVDALVCLGTDAVYNVTGLRTGLTYVWSYRVSSSSPWIELTAPTTNLITGVDAVVSHHAGGVAPFGSKLTITGASPAVNNYQFICNVQQGGGTKVPTGIVDITVQTAPVITAIKEGLDIKACEGNNQTMEVSFTGDVDNFRWVKNIDKFGGTGANPTTVLSDKNILNINNLLVAHSGSYQLRISNAACGEDIENIDLEVNKNAEITVQPTLPIQCSDVAEIKLGIEGDVYGTKKYKWFANNVEIAGATNKELSITGPYTEGTEYKAELSGDRCASEESNTVVLSLFEDINITYHPSPRTIFDGDNVQFAVAATGAPVLNYQWQYLDGTWKNLTDGGKIAGANTNTLRITNAEILLFNNKEYRCLVTNHCATEVPSNPAKLTILTKHKIDADPVSVKVCQTVGTVHFECKKLFASYGITWMFSDDGGLTSKPLSAMHASVTETLKTKPDGVTEILEITNPGLILNTYQFKAVVDDGHVSTDSESAWVNAQVFEPMTFDNILDEELCYNVSKQIQIKNIKGTGPYTINWMKGGTTVSTTDVYDIDPSKDGDYTVNIDNGICPTATDNFNIYHYKELLVEDWANPNKICKEVGVEVFTIGLTQFDPRNPVTYSWTKNGGAEFSTNQNINLDKNTDASSGNYKVVVSDAASCSTYTRAGAVTVYDPIAKVSDWSAAVMKLCKGDELKLETDVAGDVINYNWTKTIGGVTTNITGGKSFVINKLDTDDEAIYKCVVRGHCGADVVYTADVRVLVAPEITKGIDVLAPVCESVLGTEPNLILGPVTATARDLDYQWTKPDGTILNGPAMTSLNLGKPAMAHEGVYRLNVSNICGNDLSVGNQVVNPVVRLANIADILDACEGEDIIFRAKAVKGRDLHYQWFLDGVAKGTDSPEFVIPAADLGPQDENTPRDYTVRCELTSGTGCGTDFKTATLRVRPITILQRTLKNVVAYVGKDYTLDLEATGFNLSYAWEFNDGVTTKPLAFTGSAINFTNIKLADQGTYKCTITGACGVRVATGKLVVKEAVHIKKESVTKDTTICEGTPLVMSIETEGRVDKLLWFKDDVEITGITDPFNFTINDAKLADAGIYKYELYGEGIDIIEKQIPVRVRPNTILNEPLEDLVRCEKEALFAPGVTKLWGSSVTGGPDLVYSWKFKGAEIGTDQHYNKDNLSLADEGVYELTAKGQCGTITATANLNVVELPVFKTITKVPDLCENTPNVRFIAEFDGEELDYVWLKDGVELPGKTTPVLTINSVRLSDAGTYKCIARSRCDVIESDETILNVIPQLSITDQPLDVMKCEGEDVAFSVTAVGTGLTYQWTLNGVDIAGATNPDYSITAADPSNNGFYTCKISDVCTAAPRLSKPAQLVINELPDVNIFGRKELCAFEKKVTYATELKPNLEYLWEVESGAVDGSDKILSPKVSWEDGPTGKLIIKLRNKITGCAAVITDDVKLNALPTVLLGDYAIYGACEKEFDLSGGSAAAPDGPGTDGIYKVDGITQRTFNPSDRGAGEYDVVYSYTNAKGCSNVSPVKKIIVDPLPTVSINDDTTVGKCKPFNLTAVSDATTIKWSPAANLDDPTSKTPVFTPGESTVLEAVVTDAHGCIGADKLNLTVAPVPTVKTIDDLTTGQCKNLELKTDIAGDGTGIGVTYDITWTNAAHLDNSKAKSPKIISAPEGTYNYKVDVVDNFGCTSTDDVNVTIVKDPELKADMFKCEGEEIEVDLGSLENPVWLDKNGAKLNMKTDPAADPNKRILKDPGTYVLKVVNEQGCSDEQMYVINPKPAIQIKDTFVFKGYDLELDPNLPAKYGPYTYTWHDASILPTYMVDKTGKYSVKVQDGIGCISEKEINVLVKPLGIESPNAFTPLAQGSSGNNKFYLKDVHVDEIIKKFDMYIYDRWGELLYKTNELGEKGGWDGKYKGKLCPAGSYVWVVFINGKLTNKGTFVLIR